MEKIQVCFTFCLLFSLLCCTQAQPAGCPNPGDLGDINAFLIDGVDSYAVGAIATYECRLGYGSTGGSTRECLATSSWAAPQFSCVRQDCNFPPSIQNGQYTLITNNGTTVFGSQATYSCNTGYVLSQSQNLISCGVHSSENTVFWQGAVPSCENVICGDIVAPSNGEFDDGKISRYTYGSTVQFSCNSGFILSNSSLTPARCGADGSWSEFPTCLVNYGCDFEDRPPDFVCRYTNNGWERVLERDYQNRLGYVAKVTNSAGASLTSNNFTVGDQGSCLSFYYKILENNVADFSVTQQPSDGSGSPTALFTANNVTGWEKIELDLLASAPIIWKFEVSSQNANIELDFIEVAAVGCPNAMSTTSSTETTPLSTTDPNLPGVSTTPNNVITPASNTATNGSFETTQETQSTVSRATIQTVSGSDKNANAVGNEATRSTTDSGGSSNQLSHSGLVLILMGFLSYLLIGMN